MEFNLNKKNIVLNRELNKLDKFVIDFCDILEEYVIVSGYVSILFGRSRATEDIDLLIPKKDKSSFFNIFKKINEKGYECINTSKKEEAFEMLKEHAIRFSRKNKPVPNIEFKMIKNETEKYSFKNRISVSINKEELYISPIEMQIAFKLYLGSDKDLEDAKHLYTLFKEEIDEEELNKLVKRFDKKEVLEKIK